MKKELKLKKNKKIVYPSKTTLNLFYKEDRSKSIATLTIYGIFVGVLLIAFLKFGVIDKIAELEKAKDSYEYNKTYLVEQSANLWDYDYVVSQYNRYCSSYLMANETFCDRLDVLEMLEQTVFAAARVNSISVVNNQITLNFEELDLAGTADLIKKLEGYKMVESISVRTVNAGEDKIPTVYMTIQVTEEAGGEA